ncbi:PREDICTED: uncharacterized protein LOC104606292 [Nelumbo nucifera]|uniref:Uncharacterized protein LOC104606292 n=2 Tax=Nelumbo nucifera TaxID=4432 RepID=A0A1U8AQ04_NELNU|nr:PREDICTED: uncharacterized protein LOC104606292 [Nelumbo nucifera]DAD29609.1 TPA_asm: hypothetical protein HUJ06_031077 [Nelumbo nucifera]
MAGLYVKFSTSVFLQLNFVVLVFSIWCPNELRHISPVFEQKTNRFWEFEEQSNSWVEVELPFDLVSCVNGNCTKVGSISQMKQKEDYLQERNDISEQGMKSKIMFDDKELPVESPAQVLPLRKRISITKMSETSIWVTGESGSIYERFWNGVQWVITPHDLPISAGHAVSVFIVNQTILALSEAGNLYQLQISENSQPIWIDCTPTHTDTDSSLILIKSGAVSHDGEKVYFSTMGGSLLELTEIDPWRWIFHGQPPGGNVATIVDAATIRPDIVFIVSSNGDLYELDRSSRPSWKKHIWSEGSKREVPLSSSVGCTVHGLIGAYSISLFLITKDGYLIERRLHRRKWRWIAHEGPKDQNLTSITPVTQNELNENVLSLFFTTSSGSIYEYQLPKQSSTIQGNEILGQWVNHMHPPHTKAARGIPGLQLQAGRIVFPLHDGRLAELHLPGIGGESAGPNHHSNIRKKASFNYEWSVLEAPETEGWNAEYCTEERGPSNCITGIKDEPNDSGITRPTARRRKGIQAQESYLSPSTSESNLTKSSDQNNFLINRTNANFHMRVMQAGRSFFLITDSGSTYEYLYTESVWLWLKHEHSTIMKGAVGNYNGSLFLIDMHGNLLMRERSSNELAWINCTAMRKGKQVIAGPPWDKIPGRNFKVTEEDALFFVSKSGRLIQFIVALRKFKWKDCQNPPNTRIACIVDQEGFRENIVFVVGKNGRLYQYNKVTELWHEHYQSPHLVLSGLPGTAMRSSSLSLMGSLFMISEDGGLIEYHWNALDRWNWVEHGTPHKSVTLVGAPGPCFEGNQLFLIGSDGEVYLRYLDHNTWKWKNYGFPSMENMSVKDQISMGAKYINDEICINEEIMSSIEENTQSLNDNIKCDAKVTSIRPVPFSEDSVIFELKDGRLAELKQIEETKWEWSRIISTPMSLCMTSYWVSLES